MIFYFSGTGNSAYVAKRISQATGQPQYCLNDFIKKKEEVSFFDQADSILVFVLPTYGWRIPRVVEAWIEKTQFPSKSKAYFVMTCGSDIAAAGKHVQTLCSQKGFAYMGCSEIVMPENYIAMFRTPDKEEAQAIIERAEKPINQVISEIAEGKKLSEPPVSIIDKLKSDLVNPCFYSLCVKTKKFYTTDSCIGCGRCEALCPLNNIKLISDSPIWGNTCTHCMACICLCPKEAIEYGKHSLGLVRYKFPE